MTHKKYAVLLIAALLAIAGCGSPTVVAESDTPTPTVTVTAEPTPTETEEMPNPIYLTYIAEATNFAEIFGAISEAAGVLDFEEAATQYVLLGSAAQRGLELESTGNPEFDAEWDAAMKDLYKSAEKGYIGVEAYDTASLETSIEYMEMGMEHIENCTEIINRDGLV